MNEVFLHRWPEAQLTALALNLDKPIDVAMAAVNAVGPFRTAWAIRQKRARLNGEDHPLKPPPGWPEMNGTPEERDARFVRVYRVELAKDWERRRTGNSPQASQKALESSAC